MSDTGRRFIVVGAGGVGSWLAPGLARMLEWSSPHSALLIVDGDNYEPKNKERQNFSSMGNKAEVLARELASDFEKTYIIGVGKWVVETTPEQDDEEVELDEFGMPAAGKIAASQLLSEGDVVFASVDNYAARKVIFDAAGEFDNIDIFTGGNDDEFFASVYHYQRRDGVEVTAHPAVYHDEYDSPEDRNPGDLSCQERAEIEGGTQLLATNMAVAAYLLARTKKTIIDNEDDLESEIYIDLGAGMAQPADRRVEPSEILQGV